MAPGVLDHAHERHEIGIEVPHLHQQAGKHPRVPLDDAPPPCERLRKHQGACAMQINQIDGPPRGARDRIVERESAFRAERLPSGDRHVDVARGGLAALRERPEDARELDVRLPQENRAHRTQRFRVFHLRVPSPGCPRRRAARIIHRPGAGVRGVAPIPIPTRGPAVFHQIYPCIWRESFVRTYLERDIPQLGPRVPAETLRRTFWTMLAHVQGGTLNAAQLARGLAVDGKTIARYLDLLVDLLLVRRLSPLHANVGKRLVKSPKVYIRDSGIVHTLLGLDDRDAVLGHPVAGGSWEGFVLENLLAVAPERVKAWFYRTAAGAEVDLVLEMPSGSRWAIEIKRGLAPKLDKGFHHAREDLEPERSFVVYSGDDRYPRGEGVEAIGLGELASLLAAA